MKLRKAAVSDIPQIQLIEKEYYGGLELPEEILRDWIENLPENFFVAEKDGELAGHIFWEQMKDIRAIPFFHRSEEFHRPNGSYFYISEIGVLSGNSILLQQLFDGVVESAKRKRIKGVVWVTGADKEGHDLAERSLIVENGFRKFKHAGRWEYAPGRFSEKHWIYLKEM